LPLRPTGGTGALTLTIRKVNIDCEKIEALKRALIGVKSKREEAFILLTAVSEDYLPEIEKSLQTLNGLNE